MSPEQTVGDSNVDGRSDIYSLGCVMYEMLAGAPPFTGPDGTVLLAKRFTDPPPSITIVRDDVPQPVDDAIRKSLAREPADRYANALDLINAIWEERSATVHAAARRTVRAPKRRRRILLAASGVGIAAAVGGVSLATRRPASRSAAPGDVASIVAAHPDTVAASRPDTVAAPRDTSPPSTAPASGQKAPDTVVAPSVTPTAPPTQRVARIPHRETPAAPPRRDTVMASRPDTMLASLRRAAIQTRTRAAASGASPLDLAAGDSLFTDSYASAGEGRRAEALVQLSRAAGAWAAAVRAVRTPVNGDSQSGNADSQPSRRAPAAPPNVTARAPAVAPAAVRGADSATARDIERDPRPEIDALIGRYARAIEARSTAAIGELYPSMTAAQQRDWEQFFQTVRDIRVRLAVTRLDVAGSSADARVEGVYEYSNTSTHRMEQHPVSFRVSLQRGAAGWRLRAIE
jgi:serine/threonine-protein kinase